MSKWKSDTWQFVEITVPPRDGGYASSEEREWTTFVT